MRLLRLPLVCFTLCLLISSISIAQTVPASSHVWIVAEENHSYEEVVGNPQMPYYNSLIQRYGLATQFYAEQHSSLPALMWYVAGAPVEPNNDTVSCQHPQDNIVRELLKKGYDWRSYQENLPFAGFQGLYGGPNNAYYRRHNPLIDFTDACPGTGQDWKSMPYGQIEADFAAGVTPNLVYITPDADEDAHNGTLQSADQWLQLNLPAILARPEFQPGGDGILFVIWDEGNLAGDARCSATTTLGCGGRVATLVIGPRVRPGYQSAITYHSENVLKTVCAAMGLTTCPGAAQNATPMADFFDTSTEPTIATQNIAITSPGNGQVINGPVHVTASVHENQAVTQTQVWDNGVKLGYYGDPIDQVYNLAPGPHLTWVLDLDSAYHIIHATPVSYTVAAQAGGVQILSPAPNQFFGTQTVHLVAHATEPVGIADLQVWDNGVKLGTYAGASVDLYYNLSPGLHTITIFDQASNGTALNEQSVFYLVL
ncbi:hypothetical protein DYQ86_18325 [Acidobacteria bacterium AB60]|nr:hypothetical protein DYQ86_18325 [Acidobacteria bacterium AB60]